MYKEICVELVPDAVCPAAVSVVVKAVRCQTRFEFVLLLIAGAAAARLSSPGWEFGF